jgi:GNAT superfamily N-acetyltransferase
MALDPEMWLGCFEAGELVGFVLGTYESRKGWLNRLAVVPEHQRKGYGKALVLEMERRLRAKGLAIFAALIEDGHEGSLRLFREAGYEEHGGMHYLRKRDYPEV